MWKCGISEEGMQRLAQTAAEDGGAVVLYKPNGDDAGSWSWEDIKNFAEGNVSIRALDGWLQKAQKISEIPDRLVVRDANGLSEESRILLQGNPGKVYRGMTKDEYDATVGAGNPIQSKGSYSFAAEGTCFADDPATAESYINFGRDDPRVTGQPNYLVEITRTDTMYTDTDWYPKDKNPVPIENVTSVWEFYPDEDDPKLLVMSRIS